MSTIYPMEPLQYVFGSPEKGIVFFKNMEYYNPIGRG